MLPKASIMCVVSHTTFVSMKSDHRKVRFGDTEPIVAKCEMLAKCTSAFHFHLTFVGEVKELLPWTGGCHIIATHAGKDGTASVVPG